jgi:hypothetical protein
MTVQAMDHTEKLAVAVRLRDYLIEEAFRLRRRAETPPERARAIQVEELAVQADQLVTNLRMEGRSGGEL